ncbi:ddx46 [Symbiodinium necroappetens]|uniref:Ddx46 protein n=1 Tax=Symbiodinium necroappetens TaxID=1628268 RepID=A0A812NLQ1_9DINO|nr:ddx46 [Symbiodinium necroappetens]
MESRRSLLEHQITAPSPIQALALPHLGSGKHAVLISETGSGKTLAYLLPALQRAREADEDGDGTSTGPSSVMILTPTRELAIQTLAEAEEHCQGR